MYASEEVRIAAVALSMTIENAEQIVWIDFLRWPEADDPEEQLRVAYARGLVQAAVPPSNKLYENMVSAISSELGFSVDGATCYDLASRLLYTAGSPVGLLEGLAMCASVRKIMRERNVSSLEGLDTDELGEIAGPWGEASACSCHPITLRS